MSKQSGGRGGGGYVKGLSSGPEKGLKYPYSV